MFFSVAEVPLSGFGKCHCEAVCRTMGEIAGTDRVPRAAVVILAIRPGD